jgi:hypothetical protein
MCELGTMSKMIQVRNVPDALHRELLRRARARRLTLTAYVQEVLTREVRRPRPEDVFARIAGRRAVRLPTPAAELLRAERAASGRS